MPRTEDRIKALADYLEVAPDTISVAYDYTDNIFETEDGEEYLVVTEEEAYNAAKTDIEDLFDDLGIDSFAPGFQDWILGNAIDEDFIDSAFEEELDYIREDDPEAAEELENSYTSTWERAEYFKDNWGERDFSKWIFDNNAIDLDAIVDECISWDGVAHFIAHYDGIEHELENNLFAYRTN